LAYLAAVPALGTRVGCAIWLVAVLAVAVCAVLSGARSFTAIGEWAADIPAELRTALGVRADPWAPPQPPDGATVRRVLTDVDGDALDAAIGAAAGAVVARGIAGGRTAHATPGVAGR
jgi:hypothetical protein